MAGTKPEADRQNDPLRASLSDCFESAPCPDPALQCLYTRKALPDRPIEAIGKYAYHSSTALNSISPVNHTALWVLTSLIRSLYPITPDQVDYTQN